MNMMWSFPGASVWVPWAGTTKPPSFGRMTIWPESFMAISCSSIVDASDEAETMVMSAPVSLTRVPNAAVMPESAAFAQGSVTVRPAAAGLRGGAARGDRGGEEQGRQRQGGAAQDRH